MSVVFEMGISATALCYGLVLAVEVWSSLRGRVVLIEICGLHVCPISRESDTCRILLKLSYRYILLAKALEKLHTNF